jgi:hypothetical protein
MPLGSVADAREASANGERYVWLAPQRGQPAPGAARPRRELQRRDPADSGAGGRVRQVTLRPQRRMRANALCWCGSGVKWKRCHRNRADDETVNYFEASEVLRKSFAQKICLHPSAPQGCGRVIGAHTLQRSGVLSKIADDGHVYGCKEGVHHLHQTNGRVLPARVGIKKASTFNGFCQEHDAELFLPIERGTVPLNAKTALLFALRAVAYELYNKSASVDAAEVLLTADAGRPFEEQAFIQQVVQARITASREGLEDVKRLKSTLDKAYTSGDYSGLRMYAVEFGTGLPIVSTGAFYPVQGFDGLKLQSLTEVDLETVVFALTYSGDRSVAIFAWRDKTDGPAQTFVNSFASLPDRDKATAAGLLAFVHLENTHLQPRWWEGLGESVQTAIDRFISTGGFREGNDLAINEAPFRIEASIQAETWV